MKHQVNWNTIFCAIQHLPWRNIWLADNPDEVSNDICPSWLDVIYQLRSSVCETRTSLGLMINAGVLFASSRRLFFGWPVIATGWIWKCVVFCQLRANENYLEAKCRFSDRNSPVSVTVQFLSSPLLNVRRFLSLRCSTRVRHYLRLLVGVVDWCASLSIRVICCRIILTASRPWGLLICRSLAIRLTTFASRSNDVRHLLLDLDPYGDADLFSMFSCFLKITAHVMVQRLSVVCRWLVRRRSFLLAGYR